MAINLNSGRERQILSVSQLNRSAKDLLETYLPLLWVEGEISNLATPSSGHWYFTLKDSQAQVRCAMFKNRNSSVRFRPEAGQKVLLRAKVSIYEGRGDYQLIGEHMEPAGFGDLQQQFEALKTKLQNQGWFDTAHKKPLPPWPKQLGIITSATGAAVHDILHVLKRRFPALGITILPVAVQGTEAAPQICAALQLANTQRLCDVIILGRGGGSIEDLWAFNEEAVAQAIYQSVIPVISAVGHEVDFTIADFVADVRAPTPSAAAEMVSPNHIDVLQRLQQLEQKLARQTQQSLRWAKQHIQSLRMRLQHPGQTLTRQMQYVDQLELRLQRAVKLQLQQAQLQLNQQQQRLHQTSPQKQLHQRQQALNTQLQRLRSAAKNGLKLHTQRYENVVALLHSVSPLNTLKRGYSITHSENGRILRNATQVLKGEQLKTKLQHGVIYSRVERGESD